MIIYIYIINKLTYIMYHTYTCIYIYMYIYIYIYTYTEQIHISHQPAANQPASHPQDSKVKNVGRYFAQDVAWDAGNAVVLVVSPRAVAGRQANPLNFSVATKLTQKLQ